jgi:hypothetical protein
LKNFKKLKLELIKATANIRQKICIELHSKGFTTLAYSVDRDTCNQLDWQLRIKRVVEIENDKFFGSKEE